MPMNALPVSNVKQSSSACGLAVELANDGPVTIVLDT